MRLRREIHDHVWAMFLDEVCDKPGVIDVALRERVAVFLRVRDIFDRRQIAGICKRVDVGYGITLVHSQPISDEVRPDKPGAARNEESHVVNYCVNCRSLAPRRKTLDDWTDASSVDRAHAVGHTSSPVLILFHVVFGGAVTLLLRR